MHRGGFFSDLSSFCSIFPGFVLVRIIYITHSCN